MDISLTDFNNKVADHLLDLLWEQWSALGVAGRGASQERHVLDPEPLLLLSLTVGRHDARLFDEVVDWLMINGAFMNVQRLKSLQKHYDFQCEAQLGSVAAVLGRKSNHALKWKGLVAHDAKGLLEPLFFMKDGRPLPLPDEHAPEFERHGLLRAPLKLRGYSQPFPSHGMSSLLLRLRALLGVNARCELLCLLGARDEIHPSEVARQTGYFPRTTQNALVEMARSGVVEMRIHNREKKYWLSPGLLDDLLRPGGRPTPWKNWSPLFRALEMLWLGLMDPKLRSLDDLTLSSEFRRLAMAMRPLLGEAGHGMQLRNESAYRGEAYLPVFMQDVLGLFKGLNHVLEPLPIPPATGG